MENEWRPAKHPLHREYMAFDRVHVDVIGAVPPDTDYNGVGPGVSFALKMKELTGVPQGLLCCAHGGTDLNQWSPKISKLGPGKSLYAAMIRRFTDNGSHIKGIFWYQGCADAFENNSANFKILTEEFIKSSRNDMQFQFDHDYIPFLQVQIGRVVHKKLPGLEENWLKIREEQRRLSEEIDGVYTISSINLELDDLIHLSGESQKHLGKIAAEILFKHITFGKAKTPYLKAVRIYKHPISGWATIDAEFGGLIGDLISSGRATGFTLSKKGKYPDTDMIYSVELNKNIATMRLHYELNEIKDYELYYGFGLNPYANITDEFGRSIPCFGPVCLNYTKGD